VFCGTHWPLAAIEEQVPPAAVCAAHAAKPLLTRETFPSE
jgi:hypothetical protein